MRRFLLLLALLCLTCCARAEDLDPVDAMAQRLCILSQQDEAIGDIPYYHGTVYGRGCKLVSIVNGVIATYGVTDRDTAVGLVTETRNLLVPGERKGRRAASVQGMPELTDPVLCASRAEEYPNLAKTVGTYPGGVLVSPIQLNAQEVLELLDGAQTPLMFVGRMTVHPDWTNTVKIIAALHDKGMDDATLCLACACAGTDTSGAPLRSGKNGHYVSALIHVGSFMESGTVYILDSLPRAIGDEPFGREYQMHAQYAFVRDRATNAFNRNFTAARISPTVIKLSLTQTALDTLRAEPEETALERRVKLMNPLILFGSCVMLLSLP